MHTHTHTSSPMDHLLMLPPVFAGIINGVEASTRQPKLVTGGVLRPYQLDGMEWLKVSSSVCVCGVCVCGVWCVVCGVCMFAV